MASVYIQLLSSMLHFRFRPINRTIIHTRDRPINRTYSVEKFIYTHILELHMNISKVMCDCTRLQKVESSFRISNTTPLHYYVQEFAQSIYLYCSL